MKAPSFAYARPATLAAAFDELERHGGEAKILAGGQSLMATLNMRLSSPPALVDITGIPGLDEITVTDRHIRIGALATHRAIERSAEVERYVPLLAQAVPHIAHVAIRNQGTIGGSLCMADPAAEWPVCCVVLDATFVLASRRGERRVAARSFFEALYQTAVAPDEILTAIEFPRLGSQYRTAFLELARRHGDYAIAGVAAVAQVAHGRLADVRIGYLGLGATPVLGVATMAAIEGQAVDARTVTAAQAAVVRDLVDPPADLYNSSATKLHLARVLVGRALNALVAS